MKTVTIVGLGYVGLPLACLCAEKGYKVYGFETNKNKVELINQKKSPIDDEYIIKKLKSLKNNIYATADANECIPNSEFIIVCVPTPVNKDNSPDLTALKDAASSIAKSIKKKSVLVIESTIYPGTVEEIILPILKNNKIDACKNDVFVAHCPERIDPGNKKWTIDILPRVIGGITKEAAKKAAEFYRSIINAQIVELKSVKDAEATKIMENTFRDVNIAFVNEMAKSFDKANVDIIEVIKGASTKPFAFMPHYPGAGVGGHCISIDPYYLISKARQLGFEHKFLSLAREINESMPSYTVSLLEEELDKKGKKIENAKIGILGLAYKADVDDIRESPALRIIEILKGKDAEIFIFDPYIKSKSNVSSLNELLKKSDYIILVTEHKMFKNIDAKTLKENNIKIVIDGRNCMDKEKIKSLGITYRGIGRH
ncbi:nucleotide sugar dehydrogenase [Candidatus Woesearchaeota archaeon]|nr:nucleotide sugar dehydrogenase [Candidatus Woesearchaeota archaeon]